MNPNRKPLWGSTLALVVFLVASCTTQLLPQPASSSIPPTPTVIVPQPESRPVRLVGCDPAEEEVEIVCEAYDLIRRNYVDPVGDDALAEAAESGLRTLDGASSATELVCPVPAAAFRDLCQTAAEVAEDSAEAAEAMVFGLAAFALDANSVYLDREALLLVEEEQGGQIEGIGALVTAEDASSGQAEQCSVISDTCRMLIVTTFTGSPAEAADLRRDDVIVAVDGVDIEGSTLDEVTAMVRGPAGSDVRLAVERDGTRFEVTITRAEVVVPVVVSRRFGDTGYVALSVFTSNADEQLASALEELLDADVETVVLDLRDNPGGLLDTSIEVASLFLADGAVVVTEGPGSTTEYPVSGDLLVPPEMEVIVLVNRGSASASEVVAAVLQERGRATLVGESTFGKNTVQQRFGLSNGGALKLTIARWVTPGGLDFGEVGVSPDVEQVFEPGEPVESVVERALAAAG